MACGLIWIGCSHSGFGARVAILRQVATTIPICARDQPAQSVANALARDWQPGDRMMVRGFFLSSYYFDDPAMLKTALYLTGGSLLAILGAWFQLRRRSMRSQRAAMVR